MTAEQQAFEELFEPLETPVDDWPRALIHYTSADAFFQICTTKKVQFSASSATNDSAEVWGALAILSQYATTPAHDAWAQKLNAAWPEFFPAFVPYFNSIRDRMAGQLYLSCWCEDEAEHPEGKLSMWRAYGADGRGMALAITTQPFIDGREKGRVPIQLFKTRYESDAALCATLQHGADVFLENLPVAKALAAKEGITAACWHLTQFWIFACATRKHPGFSEEREWRLIYCPELDDDTVFSKELEVTVVRGQLRPRLLVHARDYSELDFPGTAFEDLVQHVVIGPNTSDLASSKSAVEMLLRKAGCAAPETKVRHCTTPYRSAI